VTRLLWKAFLSGIPQILSVSDGLSVNLSCKASVYHMFQDSFMQ
jgi:hypothetical protein